MVNSWLLLECVCEGAIEKEWTRTAEIDKQYPPDSRQNENIYKNKMAGNWDCVVSLHHLPINMPSIFINNEEKIARIFCAQPHFFDR